MCNDKWGRMMKPYWESGVIIMPILLLLLVLALVNPSSDEIVMSDEPLDGFGVIVLDGTTDTEGIPWRRLFVRLMGLFVSTFRREEVERDECLIHGS